MARTIDQIFNEMITQKEATAELNGLTSSSKVAVWRLIFYICAVGISIVENLFDLHITLVNQKAADAIAGSLPWYAAQTLLYQHGDTLVFNKTTGQLTYPNEDTDLQIIKLSASYDNAGVVYIQAAKINDSTGEIEVLTTPELNGLIGYWELKKFAGTSLTITSEAPDKLELEVNIIYDATILSDQGELLTDNTIKPVENAINNYLIAFGSENYGGNFKLMDLTDAMQAADGVLNVVITKAVARNDAETLSTDILAETNQYYQCYAGYIKIDPNYPLSSGITYSIS